MENMRLGDVYSMEAIVTNPDWTAYTFKVDLAIDLRMRALCARPYPGHKHGCPKFNSGYVNCPPHAPKVFDYFHKESVFFMVVNEFDIGRHMQRLSEKHPSWSDRQLRCCLYWQSAARKQLLHKVDHVLSQETFKGFISTMCPEAMGINVTETMKRAGILLEWPPLRVARQIALLGLPNVAQAMLLK